MRLVTLALTVLLTTPASAGGDLEYGAYLAAECLGCHQMDAEAKGIPAITGWPEAEFIAAIEAYRTKERSNATMQLIAGQLGGEEIAALAAYFATLDPQQ